MHGGSAVTHFFFFFFHEPDIFIFIENMYDSVIRQLSGLSKGKVRLILPVKKDRLSSHLETQNEYKLWSCQNMLDNI